MHKTIAVMAAVAMGFGSALASSAPASAEAATLHLPLVHAGGTAADVEQVGWRGGQRYHSRQHVQRHHYPRHAQRHRHGGSAAAGILGFGVGALFGQALTAPRTQYYTYGGTPYVDAHIQWCQQRFRSYDIASDSYLNYDGNRYRCNSPY
jgi:hypothetical protein